MPHPSFRRLAIAGLVLALPFAAQAHRAWILPASTVLSSDDPWVTFDAAISNDIFHTDYHAMRTEQISAIGPDGKPVELQNAAAGKYRSTFDINLKDKGTYKVFSASHGLNASWEEGGERKFYPPRGTAFDAKVFAKEVPKKADKLTITQSSRRNETFVTAGVPNETALKPTGQGLELVPTTHPNDLFAEEAATFQLLIDGKPAVGAKITVLPGGMRYRNSQDSIEVESDAKGNFSVTWPHSGQYYLEASYQDDKAKAPATVRRGGYVATFEVLPQ